MTRNSNPRQQWTPSVDDTQKKQERKQHKQQRDDKYEKIAAKFEAAFRNALEEEFCPLRQSGTITVMNGGINATMKLSHSMTLDNLINHLISEGLSKIKHTMGFPEVSKKDYSTLREMEAMARQDADSDNGTFNLFFYYTPSEPFLYCVERLERTLDVAQNSDAVPTSPQAQQQYAEECRMIAAKELRRLAGKALATAQQSISTDLGQGTAVVA